MNLLEYTFFQHALAGSLLASILCGLIGTYIVTRRLVFISGGITHASFGGIGLGVFMGLPPLLSAAIFAVLSACGIQWFSHRRDMREDSAIAIFWTLGMSIGIICSFLTPGFMPELSSYLFGNILTINFSDLLFLGGLTVLVILFFGLFLRPLLSVSFDPEFARAQVDDRGLPAYRRNCAGHIDADHPASDSQPVYPTLQENVVSVHTYRLYGLFGRTHAGLPLQYTFGSLHHTGIHYPVLDMQDRKYVIYPVTQTINQQFFSYN